MPEKILIVDDDIDSLKLIGLMLQRQGYEITAASSGMQAISKAAGETPDLVILDVMMPDMDGYEVCRRLRAQDATKGIPIIMFTAKGQVDDKVTGFEAGADDYLTKPTHPAELASRVKNILQRTQAQRKAPERGLLIGVIGAKGGVGTSTIAANLAALLAQNEVTTLADIRPGQSSLSLAMGLAPNDRSKGMGNLLGRTSAEVTNRAIEGEIVTHKSGLKLLLCSTRSKEMQIPVNPETVSTAVRNLRGLGRHAVVDLGAGVSRYIMQLAKELDQLVLVVDPQRLTLAMAREMLRDLDGAGYTRGKLHVVLVNRAQSAGQVPWQEAEQLLGYQMAAIISPAADIAAQAADAGLPIVTYQPTAVVATQLSKIVEELMRSPA